MRIRWMAAAAVVLGMTAPTGAQAATLGYFEEPDQLPSRLIYTAAPGETNHLVMWHRGPRAVFRDPGNVITPDLSEGGTSSQQATLSQCTFAGDTASCDPRIEVLTVSL